MYLFTTTTTIIFFFFYYFYLLTNKQTNKQTTKAVIPANTSQNVCASFSPDHELDVPYRAEVKVDVPNQGGGGGFGGGLLGMTTTTTKTRLDHIIAIEGRCWARQMYVVRVNKDRLEQGRRTKNNNNKKKKNHSNHNNSNSKRLNGKI